ncbi:hypothetical protein AK812_SmicGene12410 [Symbiodinium microadriaticum]|uniref:Uncharacterized protein n=1 Tax=Symbiodinium microadriaticum TaxID=2951 RepID=A0A1Q9EAL8_SYMMI|nr:hypothetical protein AK812_SmicGene12410 [Symbiodinium microadriaticum]
MLRASREKDAAQNLLGGWCPEDATRIADQLDAEVSDAIAQEQPRKLRLEAVAGAVAANREEPGPGAWREGNIQGRACLEVVVAGARPDDADASAGDGGGAGSGTGQRVSSPKMPTPGKEEKSAPEDVGPSGGETFRFVCKYRKEKRGTTGEAAEALKKPGLGMLAGEAVAAVRRRSRATPPARPAAFALGSTAGGASGPSWLLRNGAAASEACSGGGSEFPRLEYLAQRKPPPEGWQAQAGQLLTTRATQRKRQDQRSAAAEAVEGNLTVAVKWNLQPAVVAVEASRSQSTNHSVPVFLTDTIRDFKEKLSDACRIESVVQMQKKNLQSTKEYAHAQQLSLNDPMSWVPLDFELRPQELAAKMFKLGQIAPTQIPVAAADYFEEAPKLGVLKPSERTDAALGRERAKWKRSEIEGRSYSRLRDFLASQGFSEDVNTPRIFWTPYGAQRVFPLHVAAELGYHEIVDLLIKAGAKLKSKNSSKQTALDVALRADRHGSHQLVVHRLKTQVLSARQAKCMMAQSDIDEDVLDIGYTSESMVFNRNAFSQYVSKVDREWTGEWIFGFGHGKVSLRVVEGTEGYKAVNPHYQAWLEDKRTTTLKDLNEVDRCFGWAKFVHKDHYRQHSNADDDGDDGHRHDDHDQAQGQDDDYAHGDAKTALMLTTLQWY